MSQINEQITETFENLLKLRSKYNSLNMLITSPRKSRTLYRISKDKLQKFHQNKQFYIEDKQERNLIPIDTNFTEEKINSVLISTQTSSTEQIETLSANSRTSHNDYNEGLTNAFSSSSSSSLSILNTEITESSKNSTLHQLNLSHNSDGEISTVQQHNSNNYSSKPQTANCRVHIRSITRHMLSEDSSNEI
ncbi:hypothetical protein I4U23_010200 [Adineta vaga]|nr:hypothetical protein I4U23_010200 [Adineta vaga]